MDTSEQLVLKKSVLEDQIGFLSEELGDPGRYFPYLRSKRMLDSSDCQLIRAQVTFKDQVQELIGLLNSRQSSKGEGAFDVLVDALKKQRVQAHIARALQKALAKAKEEGIMPNGVVPHPRSGTTIPEEEVAKESAVPCSENFSDTVQYEMHPQIGALPPHPTDQPNTVQNSDEQPNSVHPQHGLFPSQGESNVYTQQQSGLTTGGFTYVSSDSECELGGQSQPGSMVTSGGNTSSQPTTSSVGRDSLDMLKLEAKIHDLTIRLEKAQAENTRKDIQIRTLQQLLVKAGMPERDLSTKNFGSHSFV